MTTLFPIRAPGYRPFGEYDGDISCPEVGGKCYLKIDFFAPGETKAETITGKFDKYEINPGGEDDQKVRP